MIHDGHIADADNFEFAPVHHDRSVFVNSDAQQFRVRFDDRDQIEPTILPQYVLIDGSILQKSEAGFVIVRFARYILPLGFGEKLNARTPAAPVRLARTRCQGGRATASPFPRAGVRPSGEVVRINSGSPLPAGRKCRYVRATITPSSPTVAATSTHLAMPARHTSNGHERRVYPSKACRIILTGGLSSS